MPASCRFKGQDAGVVRLDVHNEGVPYNTGGENVWNGIVPDSCQGAWFPGALVNMSSAAPYGGSLGSDYSAASADCSYPSDDDSKMTVNCNTVCTVELFAGDKHEEILASFNSDGCGVIGYADTVPKTVQVPCTIYAAGDFIGQAVPMAMWTVWDRESGNPNAYLRGLVVAGFAIFVTFNVIALFIQTRAALLHIYDGPSPEEKGDEGLSKDGAGKFSTKPTPAVDPDKMGPLMWIQVTLYAPTLTSGFILKLNDCIFIKGARSQNPPSLLSRRPHASLPLSLVRGILHRRPGSSFLRH